MLGRRAAGLGLATVALLLNGCSSPDASSQAGVERLQTELQDPDGLGGAGGGAPGSIDLRGGHAGSWVVYAVCTGADSVQLRIRTGATTRKADVTCGATSRIPIRLGQDDGLALAVGAPQPAGSRAAWWAAVNSVGWTASP